MTQCSGGARWDARTVFQLRAAEAPAVGQRQGAAAGEPGVAGAFHVAGEPGPDQGDDRAVAVRGVDAGAADLDEVVADGGEPAQIELALRVEAAGRPGPVRREQPVGGHDLAGGGLPDQEVVAVGVERVAVQAGFGPVQSGAEFSGEDEVAQALGRAHLLPAGGEGDPVGGFRATAVAEGEDGAGRGRAREPGSGRRQHGHGGLR